MSPYDRSQTISYGPHAYFLRLGVTKHRKRPCACLSFCKVFLSFLEIAEGKVRPPSQNMPCYEHKTSDCTWFQLVSVQIGTMVAIYRPIFPFYTERILL